jgi:hypothetical protein
MAFGSDVLKCVRDKIVYSVLYDNYNKISALFKVLAMGLKVKLLYF